MICYFVFIFALFYIIRFSQRGQDECCVRGQCLSLSCQWELPIWMCVCILWSVIASSIFFKFCFICFIFWIFRIFQTFYLKSSDLSMVNPHISLNPWNPPIHGAILRFSQNFYCAIHGFHGAILRFSWGFI